MDKMASGNSPLSSASSNTQDHGQTTVDQTAEPKGFLPPCEAAGDIEAEPQKTSYKDDYGSNPNHVFADPKIAEYWRGVYEKARYEGRHRFDPDLTWTANEEIALKHKVDWRIITWAWIMFFALDLNRRNANQAISDDMLPELGMDTNDFNTGQTIFLVSFLSAELPSGLISKKLGTYP